MTTVLDPDLDRAEAETLCAVTWEGHDLAGLVVRHLRGKGWWVPPAQPPWASDGRWTVAQVVYPHTHDVVGWVSYREPT